MKRAILFLILGLCAEYAAADCCSYLTGATTDCDGLQYPLDGGFGILKRCFVRDRSNSGSFTLSLGRRDTFEIDSYTNGYFVSSNYRQTRRTIQGDYVKFNMWGNVYDFPIVESSGSTNLYQYGGEQYRVDFYYGKISYLYGDTNAYWRMFRMYKNVTTGVVFQASYIMRMTNDTWYSNAGVVMEKEGEFSEMEDQYLPYYVGRDTGTIPDTEWRQFSKSLPCVNTVTMTREVTLCTTNYTNGGIDFALPETVMKPGDYIRCTASGLTDGSTKVGLVYETGSR